MASTNREMITYTKKEIRNLLDRYPNRFYYLPFVSALCSPPFSKRKQFRANGIKTLALPLKYVHSSNKVYELLNAHSRRSMTNNNEMVCTVRLSKVRDIMFRESLECMPLHINKARISEIAKWRLELGK